MRIISRLLRKLKFRHLASVSQVPDADDSVFENLILCLLKDRQVLHGPFKGMKYPKLTAVGSSLYPKLLGTYERELAPLLDTLNVKSYSCIVDIGCAEGYYAVGLAIKAPQSTVYAYDTNAEARELCRAMATINKVSSRVHIRDFCDSNELLGLPLGQRALIISDCEGYEKTLFSSELVGNLKQHEFLIEVHDFIDSEISCSLINAFRKSHSLQVVTSLCDSKKLIYYQIDELLGLDESVKRRLVSEYRPEVMDWIYLRPLVSS